MARRSSGTKQDILDVALRLFDEHGYAGTSIREITSALDVTPAALYYHFASKEEVLQGILSPLVEAGEEHLRRLRDLPPGPATRRTALEGYYDLLVDNLAGYRLVARDPAPRTVSAVAEPMRNQVREFYSFLLEGDDGVAARVRAAAAVETIRRSLELTDIDVVAHRDVILQIAGRNLEAAVPMAVPTD